MIKEEDLKLVQEVLLCPVEMVKFDFFERKPLILVPCVRKHFLKIIL
jgi:hypothetical protein